MSPATDSQVRARSVVAAPTLWAARPAQAKLEAARGALDGELGRGTEDGRLAALSAAVARLVSDYGRSPTRVTSLRCEQGSVVTVLEDSLTRAERVLVDRGDAALVRRMRLAFAEAMTAEFVRVAEGALGRRVMAHRRQVVCEPDLCFEIFRLFEDRPRSGARVQARPPATGSRRA